ncbi:hypothetical protein ACO0K2_11865 [Undibacterium sp. MH2W]|uniref:hypothetical protein n=1 Tax=Undibacterium sp. MH2W TaxID=3413044 RepID=UPI003BF03EFE
MKKIKFRKSYAAPWIAPKNLQKTFPSLLESLVALICFIIFLAFAGYDQMEDEKKSAEVISNAKYAALLDDAEHVKEMTAIAAISNDIPAQK